MISPLDDRYKQVCEPLSELFSEEAYIGFQVRIEQEWLKMLLETVGVHANLKKFLEPLSSKQVGIIKQIETKGYKHIPATNHDTKAIEYYLKTRLDEQVQQWVHFGITSDDTKNLAQGLMVQQALRKFIVPKVDELLVTLMDLARKYKQTVMLSRTHGQYSVPTTFGKEILVFAERLERELDSLKQLKLPGKLSSTVGTYAALDLAFPDHDWVKVSKAFVESLGFEHMPITTQIIPPEGYINVFQTIQRINNILLDFSHDMWRYISDGWLQQKVVEGEVGSSVMPHKVNPIRFENAEGNLKLANGIIEVFTRELPVSRLQRDLSDSTLKRNFGLLFGHSFLAYDSCLKGLARVEPDTELMVGLVKQHPEVLAEAYQTELRIEGLKGYELLKGLTRGKQVTLKDMHEFLDSLDIPAEIKQKLKNLKPEGYSGLAAK